MESSFRSAAAATRARRSDRRGGLHTLVQGVAADLLTAYTRRNFSTFLTDRLTRLGRIKSVRLAEVSGSLPPRSARPIRGRDHLALVVPVREPGRALILEAAFDPKAGPDEWTCQLLESAASLTAILVESERLAHAPIRPTALERDGVAPLIGSSEAMRLLRDRVERVANTDFTVLIDGPSDR